MQLKWVIGMAYIWREEEREGGVKGVRMYHVVQNTQRERRYQSTYQIQNIIITV